ncbi:MAG TPA: CaiB/BaiF CoA-transferase family protein [Terrimicrobiaceae bacterium]|nr:CaiB/BaiF CoA-transferase family protein [Terrimicrobiaceae bacterium]
MRPLEGIRILDLTRVLSGPYCTMLLGDLGAEVIKVERPGEGDDTRAFAPPFQGDQAAYFLSINRNKKSITLDMKSERGKQILWRLVDLSDVLVENFRPGAMERLGFGYEAVRARRPAMIYCSISGFGDTGPQKDRAGYDVIVQGEAGIMDLTGPRDGPPHKVGTSIADLVSGLTAAQGILAALYAAKNDGRGQRVHVSMYEAVAALLTFNASIYFATGNSPRRRGNEHATIVPYETFEASDGWINLGVANDDIWRRFCAAAGTAELADDRRFATAPDRVRNRDALVPLIKAVIKQRTRNEWLKRLDDGGVPCGAIRTVAEVCDSEVLRARGMIAEMPHMSAGNVKGIKSAIHLSETVLNAYDAPPKLGEHTREVLIELLGYTSDEADLLARDGVV